MKRLAAVTAACVALLLSTRAAADPALPVDESLHIETPFTVETDGGSSLRLPPGYYLPEPTWDRLDAELRRLQDTETRLTAVNESLRESLNDAPSRAWWVAAGAGLIAGILLGSYAF